MKRAPGATPWPILLVSAAMALVPALIPVSVPAMAAGTAAQITVTPTTATPGSVVTITGTNFQPGEVVNVGFDLQPMINVLAGADGALPTTPITVPLGASIARHTIYAYGLVSHLLATSQISVSALVAHISLNAPSFDVQRVACVAGRGFGPTEAVLVTINQQFVTFDHADATGHIDICFKMPNTIVSGDNTLTAQGLSTHATASTQFTGVLPLSKSYYFAGGSTLSGDTTEMPVLNAGDLRASMVLTIYTRHTAPITQTVTIAAQARATVPVGTIAGPGNLFGVAVQADKPLAAQLVVHQANKAPYAIPGTTKPASTWYLADGYTGGTFRELVHILNPGASDALVTVRAVPAGTEKPRTEYYVVPARRIATLELNRLMPRRSISAVITSKQPVVVTRVTTFGPKSYGANADIGASTTQSAWYFPEASVSKGVQTYLSIYNPSTYQRATLQINMYRDTGQTLFLHSERIGPQQHTSVALNNVLYGVVPLTGTVEFHMAISSTVPMVLERIMYYGDPNTQRIASSAASGPSSPAWTWNFATGDTTSGAREYVDISNPQAQSASVDVTYFMTNGTSLKDSYMLPPRGRVTLDSLARLPALGATVHGVQVSSTNFVPIVAEQGLYTPGYTAGYSVMGSSG